jgi:ABC-type transport system substrate-binding protein
LPETLFAQFVLMTTNNSLPILTFSFLALMGIILWSGSVLLKRDYMPKTLTTNFLGFPPDRIIDPAKMPFVQEYFIIDNSTAKLVATGDNDEYINDLAEVIEFSDENKTIYVKIKTASFSDGSPILAKDVAYSLKRASLLGSPHTNIENLWLGSEQLKSIDDDIPGIQVISDNELRLKLTRETKEILYFLSLIDLAVLHQSQYKKDLLTADDWTGVTSGAYRVDFDEQQTMLLIANTNTLNSNLEMPQKVVLAGYKGEEAIARIEKKDLDFGMITFADYLANQKRIEDVRGYDIISDKSDGIVHLTLNINSDLFKTLSTRQWIQRKILDSLIIPKQYSNIASRAQQYFLPGAKGYVPETELHGLLSHVNNDQVPREIQQGFTIRTVSGMNYYMPPDLDAILSKTLGVPVKIDATISGSDYTKEIHEQRNFEASIIGVGMSYKVIGEAMNLVYLSKNPTFLDPSGKIKNLLKTYQEEDDTEKEIQIINQIIKQMVYDAECIPLYYFASPYFINKETVQSSKLNLKESVKFYKFKMKQF